MASLVGQVGTYDMYDGVLSDLMKKRILVNGMAHVQRFLQELLWLMPYAILEGGPGPLGWSFFWDALFVKVLLLSVGFPMLWWSSKKFMSWVRGNSFKV